VIRRHALVLAASAVAVPRAVRAQSAPASLKVGVLPAEVAGEMFYGIDEGFFKKADLDVSLEFFTNGAAIAAGIASGALDAGISDMLSIISAHARGVPFVYVAPGLVESESAPVFGFIVRANSGIQTAKDFNGKTIAVNGLKNISQIPTEAWIDRNGGDSKTVKWVELPFPAMGPAIAQGTIDAGLPNEPVLSGAVAQGLRSIFMTKNSIAPVYLLSGWVTTQDWVRRNPGPAARFAAAIREIAAWVNKNAAASAPILSKYTKIPPEVIEHMHRGQFAERFDVALMQPVIEASVTYGVISKSFPASELFVNPR